MRIKQNGFIWKLLVGISPTNWELDDHEKEAITQATQKILHLIAVEKKSAKHEQRHQPLGVSRWITVGTEHGYWAHPMTQKHIRTLKAEAKERK